MESHNRSYIFFKPVIYWLARKVIYKPPSNEYPLHGQNLTVGALEYEPFFKTNKPGIYRGISAELMLIFSKYLGFRYEYKMDTVFGSKENGTWKGIIGLINQKVINVSAVGFTLTPERLEDVDFSGQFAVSSQVAVIRTFRDVSHTYDISQYLRPFHTDVWFTTFLLWIFVSFILGCTLWFNISKEIWLRHNSAMKCNQNLLSSMWLLLCVLLLRPDFSTLPRNSSLVSVLTTFLIFVVIMYLAYNSLLVAALTVQKTDILFNDLDDVLNDGRYGICSLAYQSSYQAMKEAKDGTLQRAWKNIMSGKGSVVKTVSEGLDKVYNENFVFIAGLQAAMHILNSNCSFDILKQHYLKSGAHIVFQKNSPLTEIFNLKILTLRSSGVLNRLQQKYFGTNHNIRCRATSFSLITPIKFNQVFGPFLFLAVGIVSAFIALYVETKLNKIKHM